MNKIAVCIPCHREYIPFIDRVLLSVKNQTVLPDLVLINLSGVESSVKYMEIDNFSCRLIFMFTSEQKNHAESRNILSRNVPENIDIISFFDSDDFMHPARIEMILNAFKNYKADFFLHNYKKIDFENKPDDKWLEIVKSIPISKAIYDKFKYELHIGQCGHISGKRELFLQNPYPESNETSYASDSIFVKFMQEKFNICFTDDQLCLYLFKCPRI